MTEPKVYLVGAGPGDEKLITLRALELLQCADCVIYDGLVNPELLRYAPTHAELISVRKRTGSKPATQELIGELLVEKAKASKVVVRLKGGDPGVFGRAPEEAAVLADAGIAFEIVPGITAGLAAAQYCGIFLSDRDHSSQVLFVTGHEAADKTESSIDYEFLAKFNGSIVFYMAMGNLEKIASELINNGKAPTTPVAIIPNATTVEQRLLKTDLHNACRECKQQDFQPPAIVIVGTAADSDPRYNWFMKKPLFGKTVVITRDRRGNTEFAEKLIACGAKPVPFNSIEIVEMTDTEPLDRALENISEYDWVIFTSVNGVGSTFGAIDSIGADGRIFGSVKIACIGPRTAHRLAEFSINADFVPTVFTGAELARQLMEFTDLKDKKILLLRSEIASPDLPQSLTQAGAICNDVTVYTVRQCKNDVTELIDLIRTGAVDFLTFTSPSTVRSFFKQVETELIKESSVKVASVGPVTSAQLSNIGIDVDIEAQTHTVDGLVASLKGYAG